MDESVGVCFIHYIIGFGTELDEPAVTSFGLTPSKSLGSDTETSGVPGTNPLVLNQWAFASSIT